MFLTLLALTGLVLATGTVVAYRRTADILHPMLFLGPLFLYSTVLEPWLVRDGLGPYFPHPEDLNLVLLLHLLAIAALVIGILSRPGRRVQASAPLGESSRARLSLVAAALAIVGLTAYVWGIVNAGGFFAAFSQVKGGGSTGFGYINEAMNLGLAAAAMSSIIQYRRGWTGWTLLLLVSGLLPNLIQGTFGGRRGPLFLGLATLLIAWVVTRRRTPSLATAGVALAAILTAMVFVASQRQHLHLGASEQAIRWDDFLNSLMQEKVDEGNNFVYGAGFVLTTQKADRFTWGRELIINLFVRPVPRQLWPTKYQDTGAIWITSNHPGIGHLTESEWRSAVGWVPLQGSSAMCISDLFGEFGWGAIAVMYLIGRGFAELRFRRQTRQGVWNLLYLEALMLSIYLATQSFSAFYHRYLILACPTLIVWQVFVGQHSVSTRTALAQRYRRSAANGGLNRERLGKALG